MAKYALKKSFHIDNGELDGLQRNECFVLGYELGEIDRQLTRISGFERPVHVENRERIEESCRDAGREFSLTWMEADKSETWLWLSVPPSAGKLLEAVKELE